MIDTKNKVVMQNKVNQPGISTILASIVKVDHVYCLRLRKGDSDGKVGEKSCNAEFSGPVSSLRQMQVLSPLAMWIKASLSTSNREVWGVEIHDDSVEVLATLSSDYQVQFTIDRFGVKSMWLGHH